MTTIDALYLASDCPEILWYVEVELGGAGIPVFSFGTAYDVGGVDRLPSSAPVFDFRADFSDSATTVSALNFAIDPEDYTLKRQLLDGRWEGRPAGFYVGVRGWAKEDFVQVFAGVIDSKQFDTVQGTIVIRAQNAGIRKEVRQETYLGDGTPYEGGPELKGNKKQMGLGVCVNARPDLTSHGSLAYAYSQGESVGCDQVLDNAIVLEKGPDIGELEDIETIDQPADGTFRDQPSASVVVLGAPPSDTSNITCTFRGSSDNGGYQDTTAGIVLQLLRQAGYDLSDVEPVSYARLQTEYPYDVGIVIADGETYLSAIKRLLAGAHADFGVGPTGLFEFWLYRTGPEECEFEIRTDAIIVTDDGNVLMERGQNLPPVNQIIVNGAKNNTVQEQVAQGADPEMASFVSKEFRPYGPVNGAMSDAFPDAQSVTIDTLQNGQGLSENDARSFHNKLAPTFLGDRGTWMVSIACHTFKIRRGMRVCFETDALGLDRGSLYVERVREFLGTGRTELTLARTTPL